MKVGEKFICPQCGNEAVREGPHQKYCKTFGMASDGSTLCSQRARQKRYVIKNYEKELLRIHKKNERMRERAIRLGLCMRCKTHKTIPNSSLCAMCQI